MSARALPTASPAKVWLAFAVLSVTWGSSYLFIRVGLRHLSPLAVVSLRLIAGTAVILAICIWRRQSLRLTQSEFVKLVILATINTAFPFFLISWGEQSVASGLASVLNSTIPIFSVLLAGAILHDEPITLPKVGGVVIGFAGVITLLSRDLSHSGIAWHGIVAQAAIVLASFCYAVAAVFTRRALRHVPSLTLGAWVLILAAAETTLLSLIVSPPNFAAMRGDTIFAVLWLGTLGSGFAYVLAFFILENWGAARYTLVAYMMPLVGLTLGAVFLGESLDWRILAGSALVVAGIVLASLRRASAPSRRELVPAESAY